MANIRILTFGQIAEKLGKDQFDFETSADQVLHLRLELERQFPALKDMSYAISVNRVISTDSTEIDATSEIALLPPFSGG